MHFSIEEHFGGVPNEHLYEIDDTPEMEQEWRLLIEEFDEVIGGGSSGNRSDYEVPDWHNGMRSLFVYLYSERFYVPSFVPAVTGILESQVKPCFARFECYDSELRLIGCFLVFRDKVEFDRLSEQSGLIGKLTNTTTH